MAIVCFIPFIAVQQYDIARWCAAWTGLLSRVLWKVGGARLRAVKAMLAFFRGPMAVAFTAFRVVRNPSSHKILGVLQSLRASYGFLSRARGMV